MKKLSKYKQYIFYHLKWQLGIIVSLPCMWLFHDVFQWNNFETVVAFQFVGAVIFWKIDKLIFKQ